MQRETAAMSSPPHSPHSSSYTYHPSQRVALAPQPALFLATDTACAEIAAPQG